MTVKDWRDDAACNGQDADKFFPDPSDYRGTADAIAVCAGCPVRDKCLQLALDSEADGLRWGVFGMTTPAQRARMSRKAAS